MIDINNIISRNTTKLNQLITEYKIERSLEQLIKNFDRLYIHNDPKADRIRLMGIERQYDSMETYIDNNGVTQIVGTEDKVPTKRIQLYVLKKRYYIDFTDNEKEELIYHLNFFITLFKQLKFVNQVEDIEKNSISFYDLKGYFL